MGQRQIAQNNLQITNRARTALKLLDFCGVDRRRPCILHLEVHEQGNRTKLSVYYDYLRTNAQYSAPPTALEPAADIVRIFNQSPEIQELRIASLRPFSQCNSMTNVASDLIPSFVAIRKFVQGFSLVSKAELESGDCEEAARDSQVILKFADALRGNPTLVSRMIRVAVIGLYTQTFWEGWADQRWTDKQYEEFQKSFLTINLFEDFDEGFRGAEWGIRELMEGKPIGGVLNAVQRTPSKFTERLANLSIQAAPCGWYYQNLVYYHRAMDTTRVGMDIRAQRYDSGLAETAAKHCEKFSKGLGPFTVLSHLAVPNYFKAREVCVHNQAFVNEAAIVCALERYRHAQGHYPAALSELSPKFIDSVPADVVGDQPMHYGVTDAGFRLYSVGMDGKDNGGLSKDETSSETRDWVWIKPAATL